MPEKIAELVRKAVADAREAGDLPSFEVGDLGLERPADADNGDWTTTLALRLPPASPTWHPVPLPRQS